MKSIVWYESADETIPQTNVILDKREIDEKLKEICESKWKRDGGFDEFWKENAEDLWMSIKREDLKKTKIKTYSLWYAKNTGVETIYNDMEKCVESYLKEWEAENPVLEETPFEIDVDGIISGIVDEE